MQNKRIYPGHWWRPVPLSEAAAWEITPDRAGPGEVVLSKRNELGLLSNFAPAPFELDGTRYESMEGFWQMMLYPEGAGDPRASFPGAAWRYSRDQVARLSGFAAKEAGELAWANMKLMDINWVSYRGQRLDYYVQEKGEHYRLVVRAMRAKVAQNPEVKRVLLATGDLKLRPDHRQPPDAPPSWRYHDIYAEIRSGL